MQLESKDKTLREYQFLNKKEETNNQELQGVVNNLNKKLDYKENYYQEQFRKLNDKMILV